MNSSEQVSLIKDKIYSIRGHQVMLDFDLAKLYSVPTKQLNKAVKRNIERFPSHFMFQISSAEFETIVSSNLRFRSDTSSVKHGGRRYLPYAFTEQGVAMISGVLRTDIAVEVSIKIIDAFIAMRHFMHKNFSKFLCGV